MIPKIKIFEGPDREAIETEVNEFVLSLPSHPDSPVIDTIQIVSMMSATMFLVPKAAVMGMVAAAPGAPVEMGQMTAVIYSIAAIWSE